MSAADEAYDRLHGLDGYTQAGPARWHCLEPTCDMRGIGTWSQVDRSAAKHMEETQHGTTTRTGERAGAGCGWGAGCAWGWIMSELSAFRDHARRLSKSAHRDDCMRIHRITKLDRWLSTHGLDVTLSCPNLLGHEPHEWRWHGLDYACPGLCGGCMPDDQRALWARLADEVDAHLAGDDTDVDLFGDETPLPEVG